MDFENVNATFRCGAKSIEFTINVTIYEIDAISCYVKQSLKLTEVR